MNKRLHPSRLVETVIVTNDRPVSVFLCPFCLRPSNRKAVILRHLASQHQVPPAAIAAVSEDLIIVAAKKTTTLRFPAQERLPPYIGHEEAHKPAAAAAGQTPRTAAGGRRHE